MLCARTYLHVGCRLSYIPRLQHTLALDYERRWNVLHEKASWLIGLERGLSLLSWLSRASWCRFGPCPCPLGGGRCRRRPLTSLLLNSSNVCLVELNHFISSSVPRQPTVWESETAPQTSLTARPHGKCPSHVSHPAQCESGGTDIFLFFSLGLTQSIPSCLNAVQFLDQTHIWQNTTSDCIQSDTRIRTLIRHVPSRAK